MNLTALLAGQQPALNKFEFIQWVMRFLPLIPLFQIVDVLSTLRASRRWRKDPLQSSNSGRMGRQHILLPLIPNLSLAAILAYLQSSGLIRFMHLYMPDLAWIVRICGGFASVWVFLRTALILKALRKPHL